MRIILKKQKHSFPSWDLNNTGFYLISRSPSKQDRCYSHPFFRSAPRVFRKPWQCSPDCKSAAASSSTSQHEIGRCVPEDFDWSTAMTLGNWVLTILAVQKTLLLSGRRISKWQNQHFGSNCWTLSSKRRQMKVKFWSFIFFQATLESLSLFTG